MTATVDRNASLVYHATIVTGANPDPAEAGVATAFAHACRALGLTVHEWQIGSTQPRQRSSIAIQFGRLEDCDPAPVGDAAPIVFPFVRGDAELDCWAALGRTTELWVASADLEHRLRAAGALVARVGVSCQLGALAYHSRRALGIREADFVFLARVAPSFADAGAVALREAIAERWRRPQARFERVSVVVDASLAPVEVVNAWRQWASKTCEYATVVVSGLHDPLAQLSLTAGCDCELVTTVDFWYPWWAVNALFRGKPVVSLPALRASGLDARQIPHLVDGIASDASRVVPSLIEAMDRASRSDRAPEPAATQWIQRELSARACGLRVVDALRANGRWDPLVWNISDADSPRD